MVALLEKTDGSEGFHQIVDFLNASHIRFALSENPTIYDSHIKQFWQTATVNTLDNGEQEITATVDGHVKTVTIASVRKYLQLADAGGLSSLPNTEIFDQLSLMGYAITSDKLTFQKGHFSPQWKFMIHTILHCLSPKKTAWEQFSSNIATAIICLATNRTFNFSKLIFDVANEVAFIGVDVVCGEAATTVSSIDAGQGSGNITKSRPMIHLSQEVESLETELKQTKQTYGAASTKLIKKVKKLEQTVKTSQARRRTKIIASDDEEDLVAEDPSKQGRSMIEEMDLDAGISLVPPHVEVQGSTLVSTASPQRHAGTTTDDLTLAETLMEIGKSAAKAKGKAKMD
ncbi:hypothetical protein Tco_0417078 [Tanacetum coccineum]